MPWTIEMFTSREEVTANSPTRRRHVYTLPDIAPEVGQFQLDYHELGTRHFFEVSWLDWQEYHNLKERRTK